MAGYSIYVFTKVAQMAALASSVILGLSFTYAQSGRSVPTAPIEMQHTILPNGRLAVSILEMKGRTLALDPAGKLYRSNEDGRHWHEMKKTPWVGSCTLMGFPLVAESDKDKAVTKPTIAVVYCYAIRMSWMSRDRGKTWTPFLSNDQIEPRKQQPDVKFQ